MSKTKEIKLKRKPNCLIILQAMLEGIPVVLDDEKYVFDENYDFCVERKTDKGELILLKVNFGGFSLKNFIHWSKELPTDVVLTTSASYVLTKLKK